MKYLITGGSGFLGSNLASEVLKRGEELVVIDNLSRQGSSSNLEWLKGQGRFTFHQIDVCERAQIEKALGGFKPERVFHLAGQVAMTTSISDPRRDFETNVLGTFNVLEAVRAHTPKATVIYSSTNKVYGDLDRVQFEEKSTRYVAPEYAHGFDEFTPLDFRSPYGCSKGAADQYMLDYARVFGLNTIVFRHSSIFGGRQFSTFDQGWVGWFVQKALDASRGKADPFTISGNGKQVRDILFASDLVNCYFSAADRVEKIRGEAFNIGGGMENSLSLLELFSILEKRLETKLNYTELPPRQSDQKVFVADITKATQRFGWKPLVGREEGLGQMIEWVRQNG